MIDVSKIDFTLPNGVGDFFLGVFIASLMIMTHATAILDLIMICILYYGVRVFLKNFVTFKKP